MKIRQLVHQVIWDRETRRNYSNVHKKEGTDKYKNKKIEVRAIKDYPKIPSDFQCLVCGIRFDTNIDRLNHLEQEAHFGLYVTGMPNDSEV
ncbi:MAG TPA: hypothetical protein VH796_18195 [Nitrososphaeraceae archaeon]|jgi:hypothetical protein